MSMPPNVSAVARDRLLHRRLVADVDGERQRLAAGLLDRFGRGEDRAFELRMRLGRLRGDRDIGAVARGAKRDREPDAARRAGDEKRLPGEAHASPRAAAASTASTASAPSTIAIFSAAVSGSSRSAKKRAVAMRSADCGLVSATEASARLGEIGAAGGEPEEAEIGRRAGERLRRLAGCEKAEEMLARRLQIVERGIEASAHAAEIRAVLGSRPLRYRAQFIDVFARRPRHPPSGSLRVTRSIAWMPLVPS